MTRDERSPRKDVVNVAVAVHVEEIWTFAALDEERLSAHSAEGAHGRVHPAREDGLGFLKERDGFGDVHGFLESRE